MRWIALPTLMLVSLITSGCVTTAEDEAQVGQTGGQADSALAPTTAARAKPSASVKDVADFYPPHPLARTFSYSRIAPDGSSLVGTLTMHIIGIGHPKDNPRGIAVKALVNFRADGMMFSPDQARAIRPTIDWPDDAHNYPRELTDVADDYVFVAAMSLEPASDAGQLTLFWASGILRYLGMMQRPSDFAITSVDLHGADAPLSVRGDFRDGSATVGSYAFTFRRKHSLTSVSATLADGSHIAMVEKSAPEEQQPQPESPETEPLPSARERSVINIMWHQSQRNTPLPQAYR